VSVLRTVNNKAACAVHTHMGYMLYII